MTAGPRPGSSVWRQARGDDLDVIVALAAVIHPDYMESRAVFAERLALHAEGVILAVIAGAAVGYAIGHPWRGDPPLLDRRMGALPVRPDRYWIHDLALLPAVRGQGFGQDGGRRLLADAARRGLERVCLVAIGQASGFWRQLGFTDTEGAAVPDCYGRQAIVMQAKT